MCIRALILQNINLIIVNTNNICIGRQHLKWQKLNDSTQK